MRKRIAKPKRINLDSLYPVASANPTEIKLEDDDIIEDDYDPEEEYRHSEHKRVIPDGESAFYNAIKNGEDW